MPKTFDLDNQNEKSALIASKMSWFKPSKGTLISIGIGITACAAMSTIVGWRMYIKGNEDGFYNGLNMGCEGALQLATDQLVEFEKGLPNFIKELIPDFNPLAICPEVTDYVLEKI